MNKTVNINLGGMFFHIDEDAYQKLTRYFDAIKLSLSKSSGQEEIIKDIEMRVSELLSEKQQTEKHVVTIKEVDEVIVVMGQPEDYIIEEDENKNSNFNNYSAPRATKKLYRDKENGMVGGVLAGLGHYFGIDKVWLRIFLLIMVLAWGTGVLAYIILWIVMPEAVTTSEKLEMTGEPVTISNIEKKVREEFENVSEKIKNADFDKFGNQVKSGAEKIGSSFGDFILTVFKIFAKFLGVLLIVSGLGTLVVFTIAAITLGSSTFTNLPFHEFIESGNFTDYPVWCFGILVFLGVGIPSFFIVILGFKLVSPNLKSIGNALKYTLLALWIIVIGILISIGIKQATAYAVNGRSVQKETFNFNPKDTLLIKFKHNDYFSKNVNDQDNFMVTQDSLNNDIIYSNEVSIRIEKSEEKYAYIQIKKEAKGKSLSEAKKRAEAIQYGYKIVGNQLIFDNYLITNLKNKFRDQEVEITLYLPEGTLLKPDDSMKNYDDTDADYFLWNPNSSNDVYKVENTKIRCINCPQENNEEAETSNQTNVTINEDGATVESDSIVKTKKNFKELKIDKNGIIIKTQ
jgi:phage shock protein PspC (stress-responsive transcriptional regulator)